jgi:hypothetical protein
VTFASRAGLVSEEWAAKFSLKKPHGSHSCDGTERPPSHLTSMPIGDAGMLTGMGTLLDSDSSSEGGDGAPGSAQRTKDSAAAADLEVGPCAGDAAAAAELQPAQTLRVSSEK